MRPLSSSAPTGQILSWEEIVARAEEDGHTHDEVQANYLEEVLRVEADQGFEVPPLLDAPDSSNQKRESRAEDHRGAQDGGLVAARPILSDSFW